MSRPTHHQPLRWRHALRLAFATALTAFSAGYVISEVEGMAVDLLPLLALSIAAVMLIVWAAEIRVSRQLARNEAHLAARLTRIELKLRPQPAPAPRAEYWQIYADVLADLGGLGGADGETSTDSGRLPRR